MYYLEVTLNVYTSGLLDFAHVSKIERINSVTRNTFNIFNSTSEGGYLQIYTSIKSLFMWTKKFFFFLYMHDERILRGKYFPPRTATERVINGNAFVHFSATSGTNTKFFEKLMNLQSTCSGKRLYLLNYCQ